MKFISADSGNDWPADSAPLFATCLDGPPAEALVDSDAVC